MLPIKPIKDWRYIFLDTSTIIDFMKDPTRFAKNPDVQARIKLAHKIIGALEQLERNRTDKKQAFVVYVSAISLFEIRQLEKNTTVFKTIIRLFSNFDVTIVDFGKKAAEALAVGLDEVLPEAQKQHFLKSLAIQREQEIPAQNAKEWISDDLKILACAKTLPKDKLDVILTGDMKTFEPIAKALELPCLATYERFLPKDLFGELDMDSNL